MHEQRALRGTICTLFPYFLAIVPTSRPNGHKPAAAKKLPASGRAEATPATYQGWEVLLRGHLAQPLHIYVDNFAILE